MKTTCPYCGVGCGLEMLEKADGEFEVNGDSSHPANEGRLCSKASALGETLSLQDRLLHPQVDGKNTSWGEALDKVADGFARVIEEYGPDSVAFYVSGQLLTEDYYVANKLAKGFIGTANIDTNSRLCMASSVAGHKRAFGADCVPGCYEDWESTDLIVLTGSNTAWCHAVLYQRLVAAKKARPGLKVVVIDPRRTVSCDIADLHLPIKPGTDAFLFNGLLNFIHQHGFANREYIEQHTEGLQTAIEQATWYAPDVGAVASHCVLDSELVELFFNWFAQNRRTVTVYSQGVNQSSCGTDKVNSIINCHLLTGRIGKPGMGPFSVTGQPNAMGGREVGALSNQLAAHMDFTPDDVDRVGRFWKSDNVAFKPGLKAVELFEAVHSGQIKALWIMATNPAVSMPDATRVREALGKCELLVVSDCVAQTDTSMYADVRLPALAWGEKDGTVTNSERCISRQKAFLPGPGEVKPDWWILSQFAQRMDYQGFDYNSAHEIFLEHAALSAFENNSSRCFNLFGLTGLTRRSYDELAPVQWPVLKNRHQGQARLFQNGIFATSNGRARFIAITPKPPGRPVDSEYPLVLNTGRERDQWHTMTRTGKSPRLNGHISEPCLQIHPADALASGIKNAQLLRVDNRYGSVVLRAKLNDRQTPGQVFAPMHWNDQFGNGGCINRLVNPYRDAISGQPEFKHTAVSISEYPVNWSGFVLSRNQIDTSQLDYWVRSQKRQLWHYELAGRQAIEKLAKFCLGLLDIDSDDVEWSELFDSARLEYRAAGFIDGRLDACIFVGSGLNLPPREWLIRLFSEDQISATQRLRILTGKPADGEQDCGNIVCSCFSVGLNTLCRQIKTHRLQSIEQIGEQLQAGTNCGSCIPELRQIIREQQVSSA